MRFSNLTSEISISSNQYSLKIIFELVHLKKNKTNQYFSDIRTWGVIFFNNLNIRILWYSYDMLRIFN